MRTRYIRHSHQPPDLASTVIDAYIQEILSALVSNVHLISSKHPQEKGSVYIGQAGVILMNIHLARLAIEEHTLPHRDLADKLLRAAVPPSSTHLQSPKDASRASFLETPIGLATLLVERTMDSEASPDFSEALASACLDTVRDAVSLAIQEDEQHSLLDDDGCEVLYGRAGTLYALLRLRTASSTCSSRLGGEVSKVASDSSIAALVGSIILRGKIGAKAYGTGSPPLMWRWHRKRYLGAAHGVAGILHMLLMIPGRILQKHSEDILGTIDWLIRIQDTTGNWPTKAPDVDDIVDPAESSDLVQWCHGATGIVLMLCTLVHRATYAPQILFLSHAQFASILSGISKGASLIYRHGLLRKGVGLCHGVAGSVYALIAVACAVEHYNLGGAEGPPAHSPVEYLARAVHLAHLATRYVELTAEGRMAAPDRPWSLYEGSAGICCAWGSLLTLLDQCKRSESTLFKHGYETRSGFPGFDDILVDGSW
ncbi:hypothetical protein PC9H_002095 [Pleurotus ostreatus]|uniref:Uncharacterized protein n=1 Tax=Pleurotus ostreatus TaxID=5322 RepID=A0A8H6ZL20_PLEOS|nr:uncharacterized protein PC9H_002095 [Pleurotus ostreatus]KAF7419504.1 hypothetical protein PC9H_002095 [Pleurotus ostreatus]